MPPGFQIALLAVLALALIAVVLRIVFGGKMTPEKRERQRRQILNKQGRLGEAFITESADHMIHYIYSVHGVRYTAAQDVSALIEYLPPDHERLIGVAYIKYIANNPANSILICEEWNGLREVTGRHLLPVKLVDDKAIGHQA